MTTNSLICNFIKENQENWKELLAEKHINIGYDSDLFHGEDFIILTYNMLESDFYDPIVQEARGIIIDISDITNPTVVAWPFRKFANYHESYADKIDWSSARIQEKVDGSIIKYWFDKGFGIWRFSTNGMICPDNKFSGLLEVARITANLRDELLDRNCTYIFELISPRNQIVIKYNITTLVHLGVRNNITGEESPAGGIGVESPKEYHIDNVSLDTCIQLVESLNDENTVTHEGFVVVDKDWHRVKVKSPEYLLLHKQIGNRTFAKRDCLDLIFYQSEKIEDFIKNFDLFAPMVRFYQYQQALYYKEVGTLIDYVDALYKEYNGDKKAIALTIANVPSTKRWVLFEHLKKNESVQEILARASLAQLVKIFPDYEEKEPLRYLKTKDFQNL